jgi:hypothetical protein
MNPVHDLRLTLPPSLAVLRPLEARCWQKFSSAFAGFRHSAPGRTSGGHQTHRSRSSKINQSGTLDALLH